MTDLRTGLFLKLGLLKYPIDTYLYTSGFVKCVFCVLLGHYPRLPSSWKCLNSAVTQFSHPFGCGPELPQLLSGPNSLLCIFYSCFLSDTPSPVGCQTSRLLPKAICSLYFLRKHPLLDFQLCFIHLFSYSWNKNMLPWWLETYNSFSKFLECWFIKIYSFLYIYFVFILWLDSISSKHFYIIFLKRQWHFLITHKKMLYLVFLLFIPLFFFPHIG